MPHIKMVAKKLRYFHVLYSQAWVQTLVETYCTYRFLLSNVGISAFDVPIYRGCF